MVRYANSTDIPRIVKMAEAEHKLSPWANIPFEPNFTAAVVESFIKTVNRTAFVTDGGYLLGLVQPMGFCGQLVGLEYAWGAQDGSGLAIADRFTKWCASMGAAGAVLHNYTGDPRLARVLDRRLGMRPIGQAFYRDLKG